MSCLLSFIVITLFTAGIQIGMLAIFSMASSFLFPEQANVGFVCRLHVINHSSPEGASFLSVHRNERIPYLLCHPQHVDFRLNKKKPDSDTTQVCGHFGCWGGGGCPSFSQ